METENISLTCSSYPMLVLTSLCESTQSRTGFSCAALLRIRPLPSAIFNESELNLVPMRPKLHDLFLL